MKANKKIYRSFAHLKIYNSENNWILKQGYSQKQIDGIYDSIENYKMNTKYKSLFSVTRQWLKKKYTEIENLSESQKEYRKYLLSEEWANLKIDLFEERGKICELCSSKKSIQVHHLHYKNIFNEEPEDLIILCGSCHIKAHKKTTKKKPQTQRKKKKLKVLSLEKKLHLKKTNKKAYTQYVKKLKAIKE